MKSSQDRHERGQRHEQPSAHALLLCHESAVEREGLRPDLDRGLMIEQLVGPIYYRILITGAPADRGYAERLVEALLDGAFIAEE